MWTCSKCGEEIEDQFDSCWKCRIVSDEPITKCFKCGGTEIAKGQIAVAGKGKGFFSQNIFQPDTLRFLTFNLTNGTTLQKETYACLDCGMVWSQTNAESLREFMRKHCKNEKPDA